MDTLRQIRLIWKPIVFLLCLVPAALVVTDAFGVTGSLGANPIEAILDRFGNWTIRFIMIALAVTPLRRITNKAWLLRFRRMLGLFAFFYALMHFLTYLILDQGLLPGADIRNIVLPAIIEDIIERPFITLGFTAILLLTAMAATSTDRMRRRLGQRWQKLHYSVYVVGLLAVWHYWWQVKKGASDAKYYAVILAVLLGLRIYWYWRASKRLNEPAGK